MYKRLFLFFMVLAVAAGIGFAEGSKEEEPEQPDWRRGPGRFDAEIVELTGTIMLEDDGFPVLKSGNEEYVLMYPYYLEDEIDVRDGAEITVEGFVAPHHPRWEKDEDTVYIRVTKAVIDGEEYEVPFGPRGGRKGFGGRRPGFGRGGCCDGGYGRNRW